MSSNSSSSTNSLRDRARASRYKLVANLEARRSSAPLWRRASHMLHTLPQEDAPVVKKVLDLIAERYQGGSLFMRKVPTADSGEDKWQIKFVHKTRPCDEEAPALKDAVRKLTAALDYIEATPGDERCRAAFQVIESDPRYSGSRLFYKKCDDIEGRALKAKVEHPTHGWSRVDTTIRAAMDSLAEHMSFYEVTPEGHVGLVWDRLREIINVNHPGSRLFFRETKELGPHGEPETTWRVKVDHRSRGVIFEARSRILEEAAGQVYDGLTLTPSAASPPGEDEDDHILSATTDETGGTTLSDFVDAVENVEALQELEDGALAPHDASS